MSLDEETPAQEPYHQRQWAQGAARKRLHCQRWCIRVWWWVGIFFFIFFRLLLLIIIVIVIIIFILGHIQKQGYAQNADI